jgi:hypothetical protein
MDSSASASSSSSTTIRPPDTPRNGPLLKQARELTYALHFSSNPQHRLLRAECYTQLNYPELAISDAYKALRMVKTYLAPGADASESRKQLDLTDAELLEARKSAYHHLIRSLTSLHAYADGIELCAEARQLYPGEFDTAMKQCQEGLAAQADPEALPPSFVARPYPLLDDAYLVRDEAAIASTTPHGPIRVARSRVAGDKQDVYGVFATRRIPAHGIVLQESTTLTASTHRPAEPYPEASALPKSLHEHAAARAPGSLSTLLLARLLAACVAAPSLAHPLAHPAIARLTPHYAPSNRVRFGFRSLVVEPMAVLRHLGVDVLRDTRYDMDVLLTVFLRVLNNSFGAVGFDGEKVEGLGGLFSFFNHSCEPNVEWFVQEVEGGEMGGKGKKKRKEGPERWVVVRAKREIEAGEELFVNYATDAVDMVVGERRRVLWRWLGAPCACERCVVEADREAGLRERKTALLGLFQAQGGGEFGG